MSLIDGPQLVETTMPNLNTLGGLIALLAERTAKYHTERHQIFSTQMPKKWGGEDNSYDTLNSAKEEYERERDKIINDINRNFRKLAESQ